MRLQKFIQQSGYCSRRKAEQFIRLGCVTVNGMQAAEMGMKIDPEKDLITCNGKILQPEKDFVYLALHKPSSYITSKRDERGRKIVMDLLPDEYASLVPVGRLDYDTTGLLLFSNDGLFVHAMTHPSFRVKKIYRALLKGRVRQEEKIQFENGLFIEDYVTGKADLQILENTAETTLCNITISEGRKRQVKKMCQFIGHPVLELTRIKVGTVSLGSLKPGEYRKLCKNEVDDLRKFFKE